MSECKVILTEKRRNCQSTLKKGSEYCSRHSKLWDGDICECGCKREDHELYELIDGEKVRIGCNICGDLTCKKFRKVNQRSSQ